MEMETNVSCLRCGCQYMKVIGKELHCPRCGRVQGAKMPDDADLIEKYELDIWNTIYQMHRDGIRYEVIHTIVSEMAKTLEIQGYCENWLLTYNK